jgi:hypothetical protein
VTSTPSKAETASPSLIVAKLGTNVTIRGVDTRARSGEKVVVIVTTPAGKRLTRSTKVLPSHSFLFTSRKPALGKTVVRFEVRGKVVKTTRIEIDRRLKK